ncbi:MAG TPA: heme exporter protein CcmB [Polyangiaceae bacterium]|jgi:heme exporter protein B|nr:heme exporter protein CcmB [Polyangiaceae bacterium]
MNPKSRPEPSAPRGPASHARTWLRQTWWIARKDARIELRTGEILTTGGFFSILVTVISSLAYYAGPTTKDQVAAGAIWISTAFASVLALSRTWQREREEGALDGLLVAPVFPSAVYAGKALGVLAFLFVIEAIVVPTCLLFFSLDLASVGFPLLVICAFATPGIAASGSLFGVMTVRTRARDLVLSIVLFPLLAPTLLAAVVATRELFGGTPLSELGDYLTIMGLFDLVFTVGGLSLFGTVAEQ